MTTSGRVGGAHPSLVDGALLGREGMGSGGVSASGGQFVISFLLFPTLPLSPSLPAHDTNKLCKYWADQRDPPIKQIVSPAVLPLHPFVPS